MSGVEEFQRLVSETIAANKLSSSMVTKVRDAALRNMHYPEQVANTLLQVHSEASSKTKLSSLYIFDAIARQTRDVVKRGGDGFDARKAMPPPGGSAPSGSKEALEESAEAFMGTLSAVAEGIITGTSQETSGEQREKALKVLDIWFKAKTFDEGFLRRLKSSCSGKAPKGVDDSSQHGGKTLSSPEGSNANSMPSPYGMLMGDASVPNENNTPPGLPYNVAALLGAKQPGQGSSTRHDESTPAVDSELSQPSGYATSLSSMLQGNRSTSQESSSATNIPHFDMSQLAMLKQLAGQGASSHIAPAPPGPPPGPPPRPPPGSMIRPPASSSSGISTNTNLSAQHSPNSGRQQQRNTSNQHLSPSVGKKQEETRWGSVQNQSSIGTRMTPPQSSSKKAVIDPDPSLGDLSQFDSSSFNPADSTSWVVFAKMWFNTYNYMPSNQELMWMMVTSMQSQMTMQTQMMEEGETQDLSEMDNSMDTFSYHGQPQQHSFKGVSRHQDYSGINQSSSGKW